MVTLADIPGFQLATVCGTAGEGEKEYLMGGIYLLA